MTFLKEKKFNILLLLAALFMFAGIFLFDHALIVGISLLTLLIGMTVFVIWKLGLWTKELFILILFALAVHAGAALFMFYGEFQPFSGGTGDYTLYQNQAEQIAQNLLVGDFSFAVEGHAIGHIFPVIIGYIYALTIPSMLIGQLFNVWLSVLAIIFLYFIVLSLGNSQKWGLAVGVIGTLHPSFVFFSNLLLKEAFVTSIALAGMLALIKILQKFSWRRFAVFYSLLLGLIHFRFYAGFILLGTFILAWFLFSSFQFKKRLIYALFLIPLLGFASQFMGYGYFGFSQVQNFLSVEKIIFYKEVAYQPQVLPPTEGSGGPVAPQQTEGSGDPVAPQQSDGKSSSVAIEAGFESPRSFAVNSAKSLSLSFFGLFPWQIQHKNQYLALVENVPWYALYVLVGFGVWRAIRKRREALTLLIFSFALLALLALFFSNAGLISRIRVPAMLLMLPLVPFAFEYSRMKGYLLYFRTKLRFLR